jgi:hypothetical protein
MTAAADRIWHQEGAPPSMPVSWPSSSKMLRTSQLVVVFPALPVTPTTASFLDGLRAHKLDVDLGFQNSADRRRGVTAEAGLQLPSHGLAEGLHVSGDTGSMQGNVCDDAGQAPQQ